MRYVRLRRDNLRSHFVFRPRHAPEWLRTWLLPVVFLGNEEKLTGKAFTTSLNTTNPNTYVKFIFLRTSPLRYLIKVQHRRAILLTLEFSDGPKRPSVPNSNYSDGEQAQVILKRSITSPYQTAHSTFMHICSFWHVLFSLWEGTPYTWANNRCWNELLQSTEIIINVKTNTKKLL